MLSDTIGYFNDIRSVFNRLHVLHTKHVLSSRITHTSGSRFVGGGVVSKEMPQPDVNFLSSTDIQTCCTSRVSKSSERVAAAYTDEPFRIRGLGEPFHRHFADNSKVVFAPLRGCAADIFRDVRQPSATVLIPCRNEKEISNRRLSECRGSPTLWKSFMSRGIQATARSKNVNAFGMHMPGSGISSLRDKKGKARGTPSARVLTWPVKMYL